MASMNQLFNEANVFTPKELKQSIRP